LQQEKEADYTETFKGLKTVVIEKINDLLEELQNTAHDIAEQSLEHIHSNEVIMTLGGTFYPYLTCWVSHPRAFPSRPE
jgi:translation initiation factor eIF-2B subunit beta